jgi:hypothetical protein
MVLVILRLEVVRILQHLFPVLMEIIVLWIGVFKVPVRVPMLLALFCYAKLVVFVIL